MTRLAVDAHAHVGVRIAPPELTALGGLVMAVTRSLDEAETALTRSDALTVWGIGCHPAIPEAVNGFNRDRFASLLERAAFVGEVGLDRRSRVPMHRQLKVLVQVLEEIGQTPRAVSLHTSGATSAMLDALERHPIRFPILHWWRGSRAETLRAMELGCLFSLNGHEAISPKALDLVPLDRVLTETDFPHTQRYDHAAAQPGAVATIERALAEHHNIDAGAIREQVWATLVPLVDAMPNGAASERLRAEVDSARASRTSR